MNENRKYAIKFNKLASALNKACKMEKKIEKKLK
jgi:hypothetical protein